MKNYQYHKIVALLYMIWGVTTEIRFLSVFLMLISLFHMGVSLYQSLNEK